MEKYGRDMNEVLKQRGADPRQAPPSSRPHANNPRADTRQEPPSSRPLANNPWAEVPSRFEQNRMVDEQSRRFTQERLSQAKSNSRFDGPGPRFEDRRSYNPRFDQQDKPFEEPSVRQGQGSRQDSSRFSQASSMSDHAPRRYDEDSNRLDEKPTKKEQGPSRFDQGPSRFDQGSSRFDQGSSRFDQGSSRFDQGSSRFDQGSSRYNQSDKSGPWDRHLKQSDRLVP